MNAKTDKPTAVVKFHAVRFPDGGILGLCCYGGPFGPGHIYGKRGGNYPTATLHAPRRAVSPARAAAFLRKLPPPLTGPAVEWLADREAANGPPPAPQAVVEDGWKPASAPPDTGRTVLACRVSPYGNYTYAVMYHAPAPVTGRGWWSADGSIPPTHWRELPPPPAPK